MNTLTDNSMRQTMGGEWPGWLAPVAAAWDFFGGFIHEFFNADTPCVTSTITYCGDGASEAACGAQ